MFRLEIFKLDETQALFLSNAISDKKFINLESGASNNKCTETYHGPEAFSEPETANIRDYTLTLDPVPVLSHTLHSYSQLWLWPYGYAYDAYPENYVEIRDLAKEAVDALQAVHGTVFDPINSADLCKSGTKILQHSVLPTIVYFLKLSLIQSWQHCKLFIDFRSCCWSK